MNDINKTLDKIIDEKEGGIKVTVGMNTNDILLLGAVIFFSVLLAGVLIKLLTRNF